MYYGILRTLTEVQHVLDLKKNLISLGAFDSNDCKLSAEGGVIKVMKGVLVLMKGKRVRSLYVLSKHTVKESSCAFLE